MTLRSDATRSGRCPCGGPFNVLGRCAWCGRPEWQREERAYLIALLRGGSIVTDTAPLTAGALAARSGITCLRDLGLIITPAESASC